jgi:hypothetical protein
MNIEKTVLEKYDMILKFRLILIYEKAEHQMIPVG